MLAKKSFRLPSKLVRSLEKDAERRKVSQNNWVIQAIQHFLKCQRTLKYKGFQERIMTYRFACFECNKKYPRGRLAMYDTETGATMCIECAIENEMTDKATVNTYIKKLRGKRDLRAISKACKEEAEKLLDLKEQIDIYGLGMSHEMLEDKKNRLLEWIEDFMQKHIGTDRENQAIQEIQKTISEIEEVQEEIRGIIRRSKFKPLQEKVKITLVRMEQGSELNTS